MEESTRYVTWDVHREFEKRVLDENDRQNHRISDIESSVKEIQRLTVAVEKLGMNIESMVREQQRQSDRLTAIEDKPTKRWDAVITGLIGAVVGALGAALMSGIIH